MMIQHGAQACFMKDKKGLLPAHVACMRHCSPEKLRMLLSVNPGALYDKTAAGHTPLDLANKKATKAHPNYVLIDELKRQLAGGPNEPDDDYAPPHSHQHHQHHQQYHIHHHNLHHMGPIPPAHHHRQFHQTPQDVRAKAPAAVGRVSSEEDDSWNRARLDSNESNRSWTSNHYDSYHGTPVQPLPLPLPLPLPQQRTPSTPKKERASRKRKAKNPDPAADLLLHFSRNSNGGSPRRSDNEDEETGNDDESQHHHMDDHPRQQQPQQHSYAEPSRVAEV